MVSNIAFCVIPFLAGFVKHFGTSRQIGFIRLRVLPVVGFS
jgi:hypothetical protein